MNNPFDLLMPEPKTQGISFRFGTVTSVDPLRVRLDGDTNETPMSPTSLVDVSLGSRILVSIHNLQMVVLGTVRSRIYSLNATQSLDDLTTNGTFIQRSNSNASTARGYPIAMAGMLEVFTSDTSFTYQRYTNYRAEDVYTRVRYNGSWSAWTDSNGSLRAAPEVMRADGTKTIANGGRSTMTAGAEKTVVVARPGIVRAYLEYEWYSSGNAAGYAFIIAGPSGTGDGPKYRFHNHNSGLSTWRQGSAYHEAFATPGNWTFKAAAEIDAGGTSVAFNDVSMAIYTP